VASDGGTVKNSDELLWLIARNREREEGSEVLGFPGDG
jgi:hypothetical protein